MFHVMLWCDGFIYDKKRRRALRKTKERNYRAPQKCLLFINFEYNRAQIYVCMHIYLISYILKPLLKRWSSELFNFFAFSSFPPPFSCLVLNSRSFWEIKKIKKFNMHNNVGKCFVALIQKAHFCLKGTAG